MNNHDLRKYIGIALFILLIFIGQQLTPDTKVHLLSHFGIFQSCTGMYLHLYL